MLLKNRRAFKLQNTETANDCSREGYRNDEYLIPGLEPEDALDVLDDGSAELLGGGGGLDLVYHGERGGLEAPPRVRGHGRGVRVRRHGLGHQRALADVHHGHPRERAASRLLLRQRWTRRHLVAAGGGGRLEQERTGRWAGAIGTGEGQRSARRRRRGRARQGRGGELGIWEQGSGGDFNASRKRLKEHLTCGAHTSVSGGREAAGGVLVHTEDVYMYTA